MLTAEELVDRLRVFSPGIVADLYDLVLRGLRAEEERETRFDTKAHVVLMASAIMMAVVVITGVMTHPIAEAVSWPALLYFVVLFAGTGSLVCAIRVVFVSGEYRGIDEREVLDLEELGAADNEFLEAQKAEKEERGNVRAQGRYRRLLIAHWWQMWQQHYAVHEKKAKALRIAQAAFLVFVAMVMAAGVALAIAPTRCA
jgi:hypothetical protein